MKKKKKTKVTRTKMAKNGGMSTKTSTSMRKTTTSSLKRTRTLKVSLVITRLKLMLETNLLANVTLQPWTLVERLPRLSQNASAEQLRPPTIFVIRLLRPLNAVRERPCACSDRQRQRQRIKIDLRGHQINYTLKLQLLYIRVTLKSLSFNIITIINTLKILCISLFGYLLPFLLRFYKITLYFSFQKAYISDSIYITL